MSTSRTARRVVAVAATAFLALGGSAVAASAAFADGAPAASAPTFTLTDNGGGSFSLLITVPGTSIAVDYAVDATGAVTSATTSTAGATVTVHENELTITLADGTVLGAEVGDAGKVDSVEADQPDPQETPDAQDTPDPQETPDANQGSQDANQNSQGDHQGSQDANQNSQGDTPDSSSTDAPAPAPTDAPSHDGQSTGDASSAPDASNG